MNAPNSFARLVQIVLPAGGNLIFMVEGYFDESGDVEIAPHVFCIAGYVLETHAAIAMDKEWRRVLRWHNLPYFHMVDCAPGNGVFQGRDVKERIKIEKRLIRLIKDFTIAGVATTLHYEHPPSKEYGSDHAYLACADMAVTDVKLMVDYVNNARMEFACFFESGHKSRGRFYGQVADKLAKDSASVTFGNKQFIPLLQAADLLAWQVTKNVKRRLSNYEPRKDFLSLMEHRHHFAVVHLREDGGLTMEPQTWWKGECKNFQIWAGGASA